VEKHLTSKCKVLSSNPNIAKRKKKTEKKEKEKKIDDCRAISTLLSMH
jgi:hypothetical protein